MSEAAVREAFALQGAICTAAGAPFTGRVCRMLGEKLDRHTAIGRRVLDWPGVPTHDGDALALRLAGGLHALARSRQGDLAAFYPPNTPPRDDAVLWRAIHAALLRDAETLDGWLDGPPQTNEVGRSSALMAGLLVLADRFGLPFALYELGASAGLNTILDRYGFQLGRTRAGAADSPVRLAPEWRGGSPPAAEVRVVRRRGVDRQPLDPRSAITRERLQAYVWAEQRERLARLGAALELAAADPAPVDEADAADWLEAQLSPEPEPGVCRVVMHTIAFQYFPPEGQARIAARIAAAGARAGADSPVAWLAYEAGPGQERRPQLVLRSWPGGGEQRVLAEGQPHGAWLDWRG